MAFALIMTLAAIAEALGFDLDDETRGGVMRFAQVWAMAFDVALIIALFVG